MNRWLVGIAMGLLFLPGVSAQQQKDSLFVPIQLRFGAQPLEANKYYVSKNQDSITFTAVRFYISNVALEYNDKSSAKYNSYFLVDLEKPESLQLAFANPNRKSINQIKFCIGVDSLASVSGAQAGNLDPVKGMYWAWQSGYINMKIEGQSPSCLTRKQQFHFHLGGYLPPHCALRDCVLSLNNKNAIIVDLAEFFSQIQLRGSNAVMIPGKEAMELADYSVTMFKTE